MGNKIGTEEDYWMCTGGIMPAQMQTIQLKVKQDDAKKYLLKTDTATSSMGDFVCKWVMLIAAAIAAIVVVAVVATGGAALGAIVMAGAIAGASGAAVGSIVGGLICGQKAAIARTWIGEKVHLMIAGQKTLTSGSTMQCPIFSSTITHAPNVKNFWDALRVGIGNFAETVIMGALGGALIGVGGAVISGAAALAVPTFGSIIGNVVGSVTGVGMAVRLVFGANAVSNQQAPGQIDINNQDQRDAAFGNAAFPEYGSMKRILSGHPEPMDAMLLLYFLNLRVPGTKPGASPKEEPTGGNKEENAGNKENETKQPVENKAAEPETAGEGKKGKAYEGGQTDPPGTFRDRNGILHDSEGRFAKDPKRTEFLALMAERTKIANDFYKKYYPKLTNKQLKSRLDGIDFRNPVEVIKIPKNSKLYQYTKVNEKGEILKGEYYSDVQSNNPSELGISEKYNVPNTENNQYRQTNEVRAVEQREIRIEKDINGLKSTSAKVEDTWSRIDENGNPLSVATEGGGSQIYIPKNQ